MIAMKKMMTNGLTSMLFILFLLLFIQFFLGMYINLFVVIPVMSTFMMMGYGPYGGFPIVMAHMFIGILIGLLSIGILFISAGTGERKILMSALGLFFSVLIAGIDGLFFLFDGQNNINSYLMSTGFIFAMLFAILLLVFIMQPNFLRTGNTNFD